MRDITRQRILDVAAQLNYRPLAAARNMRRRSNGTRERTYVVGFVTFRPSMLQEDPYTLAAAGAVESALRQASLEMRLIRANPEGRVPGMLLEGECDGVIVRGRAPLLSHIAQHVPTVAIETWIDPPPCYCLIPDYETQIGAMTRRLLDSGRREIVLAMNRPDHPLKNTYMERVAAGYRQAYLACGLPLPRTPYVGHADRPGSGYDLGRRLFNHPPEVVVGPDGGMLGLYRAALERGLRVGRDIEFVGIDGLPESEFLFPPLTVVHVDLALLARRAVAVLGEMMASHIQRRGNELLPMTIVERASTGGRRNAT